MADAPMVDVRVTVNGHEQVVTVHPMARLLDVLRVELHLTGTKEGCGEGECGACAVLVNGELVNSCLMPVLAGRRRVGHDDRRARAERRRLHRVQQAFLEHGGAQCGICTPGMILAAVTLLERHPHPTDEADPRGPRPAICAAARATCASSKPSCARRTIMRAYLPAYDLRAPETLARGADAPGRSRQTLASVRRRHRPHGALRRRDAAGRALPRPVEADRAPRYPRSRRCLRDWRAHDVHGHSPRRAASEGVSACWVAPPRRPAASPRRIAARSAATSRTRHPRPTRPRRSSCTTRSSSCNPSAARDACPTIDFIAATRTWISRPTSSSRASICLERRAGGFHYYRKVGTRRAQAISKVCLAAWIDLDPITRTIRDVRVAVNSVAPMVKRCHHVEDVLRGRVCDAGLVD